MHSLISFRMEYADDMVGSICCNYILLALCLFKVIGFGM